MNAGPAADRVLRERFAARADLAPNAPRVPLLTADAAHTIGSLESALGARLAEAGLLSSDGGDAWRLPAGPSHEAALEAIARWMHTNRFGGRWRDELLSVVDTQGVPVARIERAAVRPLGIATHAVHLVGRCADGRVWVQQRALDKATDPGLWDTLMGGLVSADESIPTTLERETWEEAGLQVAALHEVRGFGRTTVRRPVADGYMVEHIEMFDALVPDALSPLNQDGEVAQFARLSLAELRERLDAEQFTLEAALILAHWLETR